MNLNEYKISDEDFEDLGFKDIEVPKIQDFDIKDYYNRDELKDMPELYQDLYPFFDPGYSQSLQSNRYGFEDSSSYDSEDYYENILD
jgi:hypothetical protein|tara:strand:- start:49 stop:309 length:261 start_codon:yes stop_codon:yes gene_type:complete